jgi:SAM-dependent methyltransferase
VDSAEWDERYAAADLVWSAGPNAWVEMMTADLPPGRALDLAAGECRNALWLAERGWTVTAVDFSGVALDRAQHLAEKRLGENADRLTTVRADVVAWTPEPHGSDLVLVVYLHLPPHERLAVLESAARAVAPGGALLVVGHDLANLHGGVGGPQDPTVLCRPEDVVADLEPTGLAVQRADTVRRPVVAEDGSTRDALDLLVLATRPLEAA